MVAERPSRVASVVPSSCFCALVRIMRTPPDPGARRAPGSGGVRMIRTKAQKQELGTTLATRLGRSATIYVTDFTGLSVAKLTQLRRRLRQAGTEFVVVKNTLARRALADAHMTGNGGGERVLHDHE